MSKKTKANAQAKQHSRLFQWRGRLAAGALRLFARLPLGLAMALGSLLGRLAWWFHHPMRTATEINIAHCFPELPATEQKTMARESLLEDFRGGVDIARTWCHPDKALASVCRVTGEQAALEQTLAQGQPVVILAPHLGSWEIANFWLGKHFDFHALYKPSPMAAVDELIFEARQHFGSTVYPATPRGVAGLVRALKRGAVTAILPDQVPLKKAGRLAPFFGQPAWTGTLPSRLIQQSRARAFMLFARRLPDGHYEMILRDPDPELYNEDLDQSLAALNRSVEALILEAPLQYTWSYKRFRRQKPEVYPLNRQREKIKQEKREARERRRRQQQQDSSE